MSERTDSQINEIIHRNIYVSPPPGTSFVAVPMPDYTDPTSYLEAMAWAKEQDWWLDFIQWLAYLQTSGGKPLRSVVVTGFLLDPKLGSHALAEFLEGREG